MFLGPSGIGKTTILRTIAGLEKIDKGKIILKNKFYLLKIDMSNLKIEIYLYAFQDNSLFPHYNVEKNIEFGA